MKESIELGEVGNAAESGARFGLQWGEFSEHLARNAVEHCHMLDPVELNLLRYLSVKEPLKAEEIAPILGKKINAEADEFEQKRQRDAVLAQASARLAALEGQLLCMRTSSALGEYDFTREGFELDERTSKIAFGDLSQSAEQFVSRLETATRTRRPDNFEYPAFLLLIKEPDYLQMPESRAESILRELPKSEEASSGEAAKTRDLGGWGDIYFESVWGRMSPESMQAMLLAEEYKPKSKEEMPVGQVFKELWEFLPASSSGRLSDIIVVFKAIGFEQIDERVDGTSVKFKVAVGVMNHLVAITPSDEVFAVAPARSPEALKRLGQRVDPDLKKHTAFLEEVCGGAPRNRVSTTMKDGELVDTYRPVCRKCPPGADSSWGSAGIGDIYFGSFSHPGTYQALVHTNGCESEAGGGGGMTLVEQHANGDWTRVHYTAGAYDKVEVIRDPSGRDLLLFESTQMNGGYLDGGVMLTAAQAEELSTEMLFPIANNLGSCRQKYLAIRPSERKREDINNDGVLDVIFSVNLAEGVRDEEDCGFEEEEGIAPGETLELAFRVEDGQLLLDEGSKAAYQRLLDAKNRGGF